MLNRVDFFKADRSMSTRVVEYMRCKVWKKAIQLEYAKKINDVQKILDSLEKLSGSLIAEKSDDTKISCLAQIAKYEKERDEQIEKETKFSLTDADKVFKKAVKKADGAADLVAEAVCAWFKEYGVDVENTYFLEEVLSHFGSKFDFRKLVTTDGADARALDASRALDMMYATAYTHMATVGTIKVAQIPEIVRDKYAPKKSKKQNKGDK